MTLSRIALSAAALVLSAAAALACPFDGHEKMIDSASQCPEGQTVSPLTGECVVQSSS